MNGRATQPLMSAGGRPGQGSRAVSVWLAAALWLLLCGPAQMAETWSVQPSAAMQVEVLGPVNAAPRAAAVAAVAAPVAALAAPSLRLPLRSRSRATGARPSPRAP